MLACLLETRFMFFCVTAVRDFANLGKKLYFYIHLPCILFIYLFFCSVYIPNPSSNPVNMRNAPNTPPPSPAAEDVADGGGPEKTNSTLDKEDTEPLKKAKTSSLGENYFSILPVYINSLTYINSIGKSPVNTLIYIGVHLIHMHRSMTVLDMANGSCIDKSVDKGVAEWTVH